MQSFITRIELYGRPESEDYDKLHEAMEGYGFSRTITSDEPGTYHLPNAEYYRDGENLTSKQVIKDAKAAAASAWTDHSVLVAETKPPVLFFNLRRASYYNN